MEDQAKQAQNWWQKNRTLVLGLMAFVASALLIVLLVVEVRLYGTGFEKKTLFDWLTLIGVLAVPIIVGFGVVWITRTQQLHDNKNKKLQREHDQQLANQRAELERAIALDNQQETALQTYIDRMSELLRANRLGESVGDEQIRQIARVRTLTVLRRLDAVRNKIVVQFLQDTGLLSGENIVIDLSKANLSGADLSWANLNHANLMETNLSDAHLDGADMRGANLMKTNLSNAHLSGAGLSWANLSNAHLDGADLTGVSIDRVTLSGATLIGTDLSGAFMNYTDLSGADLSGADLSGVYTMHTNLSGARYTTKPMQITDQHRKLITLQPTRWRQGFDYKAEGTVCVDC